VRILFLGGFLRGYRLLRRLVERGESVVGAFVFEEDPHEEARFAERIAALAEQHGIPVEVTRKLGKRRAAEVADRFRPDVIFCLGWRTMLPEELLELAPGGVVAAHDSLLPRLRGFAPTNWALLLGHDQVGATLFRLTPGVDEGDVYFQQPVPVTPQDTLAGLVERIADASVGLFERYLDAARDGTLAAHPQEHAHATYTCARTPQDGEIDWSAPTDAIVREVRALAPPAPGAYTYFDGRILRVLSAWAVEMPPYYEGRIPGRVVARDAAKGTVDVLSGDGVIRVETILLEDGNGEPQAAAELIKSVRAHLGLRPAWEIARLHQTIAALREQIEQLERQLRSAGVS